MNWVWGLGSVSSAFGVDRSPLEILVNLSVFPAGVLSFRARAGQSIAGFSVEIMGVDARLRGQWGDPVTREPDLLVHGRPVDVYVFMASTGSGARVSLEGHGIPTIATTEDFLLLVSWVGCNGNDVGGEVVVYWRGADRISGRGPIGLYGADATAIREYSADPTNRLTIAPRVRGKRIKSIRTWGGSQRQNGGRKVDHLSAVSPAVPVRVSGLTLRGLRGFRSDAGLRLAQPTGVPGSGLTIVVGANNAGKSTIWEAFDALARKSKFDVSFSEGRRNRLSPDGVHIRLDRVDGSAYSLRSRNPDTSETVAEWITTGNGPQRFEIVSVPSRRQFNASFGKNVTSQRDWMTSGSDFSRSRQFDQSSQFTGRLFDLHNDEAKKAKFDSLMGDVLGHELKWMIDLADGQQGQSYYLKIATGDGSNHTSEGLGDGIISLLFILNALYDSEPGTLVTIDEPELSLHPQHVRRLGRLISRFARDRQIVVFTHSPALVSWDDIAAGAEIARVFREGGQSLLAQASRSAIDDISRARGGWVNPHVFGSDANATLFLDDGVIVVEGQEDAALLPTVFEQLEIPFNGAIFGWGSGGESNVERILTLLFELGFKRVAAVLDNDVPETSEKLRARFPGYLVVEIPAADIRDKPAKNFSGKAGLMDRRGRRVKPELEDAAREVLQQVSDRLAPTPRM